MAAEPRSRWRVVVGLLATVGLGLLSRHWSLPGLLAKYPGDALYTVAAYWGLALVAPSQSPWRLAGLAFLASAAVEACQLVQWPWLVELRGTPIGALVLGQGFHWADFLAYGLGALGVGGLDARWRPCRRRVLAR